MTRRSALAALAILAGCADRAAAPVPGTTAAPPAGAISKVTEAGPVKVTVTVWPPEPRLGDPIHVRLTAQSQEGVAVDLPYQETTLGRFDVVTYARSETRTGATRVQVQDYELDAPSSGRHRIPPFRLEMLDPRATGAGSGSGSGSGAGGRATAPVEILTEEVPIQVKEIEAAQAGAALPAPRGTLPPDVGGWPWWAWVAVGLGAAWIALGVALVVRLRKRRAVRLKIGAYERAIERLRILEDRGAPAGDAADAWFVELSSIVRRYLEGRYDIRAPELTTEEFLAVASRSAELTLAHRELLSSFMAQCDRVKFAGYRPDAAESLATLDAARGFVEDTRLRATEDRAASAPAAPAPREAA